MRIPFRNKGHQPFSQMIQVGEVADTQPLALHKAEPLFDLVHPGAMRPPETNRQSGDEPGARLAPVCHYARSSYRGPERCDEWKVESPDPIG